MRIFSPSVHFLILKISQRYGRVLCGWACTPLQRHWKVLFATTSQNKIWFCWVNSNFNTHKATYKLQQEETAFYCVMWHTLFGPTSVPPGLTHPTHHSSALLKNSSLSAPIPTTDVTAGGPSPCKQTNKQNKWQWKLFANVLRQWEANLLQDVLFKSSESSLWLYSLTSPNDLVIRCPPSEQSWALPAA